MKINKLGYSIFIIIFSILFSASMFSDEKEPMMTEDRPDPGIILGFSPQMAERFFRLIPPMGLKAPFKSIRDAEIKTFLKKYKVTEIRPLIKGLRAKMEKDGKDFYAILADLKKKRGIIGEINRGKIPDLSAIYLIKSLIEPEAIIKDLASNPQIYFAEPNSPLKLCDVFPDDEYFPDQYYLYDRYHNIDIDVPGSWELCTGDEVVTVAVIDSGVDYTHPDLQENIWLNPGELSEADYNGDGVVTFVEITNRIGDYNGDGITNLADLLVDHPSNIFLDGIDDDNNGYTDDFFGWRVNDYISNNNPMDSLGHGTACAGIIGATGNNEIGVCGVNWRCRIVPFNISLGGTSASLLGLIDGIYYAAEMGIPIINLSAGGDRSIGVEWAIQAYNELGGLLIAAAGNWNNNNDIVPFYPASCDLPNIIAVTGVSRNGDLMYSFGPDSVDLSAPGSQLVTTGLLGGIEDDFGGTSGATPIVTGVTALLKAYRPLLNNEKLKAIILGTVRKMDDLNPFILTGGMVNAKNALECNNIPPIAIAGEDVTVYNQGQIIQLHGTGYDLDGELIVSFHWTQIGGPPVGLNNPYSPSPSFTLPEGKGGELVFRLEVSDGNSDYCVPDVVKVRMNLTCFDFRQIDMETTSELKGFDIGYIDNDQLSDAVIYIKDRRTEEVSLVTYLSVGGNQFALPVITNLPSDLYTLEPKIYLSEINNDPYLDLLLALDRGHYKVIYGTGDGYFENLEDTVDMSGLYPLVIKDFNSDNKNDFAFTVRRTFQNEGRMGICFHKGENGFSEPIYYRNSYDPTSICSGDFNSDGYPDIAVLAWQQELFETKVSIYYNNGDNTFSIPLDYHGEIEPWYRFFILSSDFNNDSNPDLLLTGTNKVRILYGDGNGLFSSQQTIGIFESTCNISFNIASSADIDGNGLQDIVLLSTGCSKKYLAIILNIGHRRFSKSSIYRLPEGANSFTALRSLRTKDLNGDGKSDLGISHDNYFIIGYNQTPPLSPRPFINYYIEELPSMHRHNGE